MLRLKDGDPGPMWPHICAYSAPRGLMVVQGKQSICDDLTPQPC